MTEPAPADLGTPWLRRAVTVSRWLFGPAALLFLLAAGLGARETLAAIVAQAAWTGLAAAAALWAALHLLSPVFTVVVLRRFGARVGYRDAMAIHVRRLPARYLPGGIWHTVSRVVDLHRLGVSRGHLAGLVLLENAVPLAMATALGGGFLLLSGRDAAMALACMAAGLALLAITPLLLRHRAVLGSGFRLGRAYLAAAAVTTLFWLLAATAFAIYWASFPDAQAQSSVVHVYASYLLGWAAGFVAIFAPQGLGVFESVASLLLRGMLPFGGIALLVAGFRVVILAADAIAYAAYAGVAGLGRRAHA